jgi:nitroreductase
MKAKVLELLRKRRSVYPKLYGNEVVEDHIINEMLEAARWAPTHRLTEPWKFTVFTGDGLDKLGHFQAELYKEVSSSKDEFNEAQYLKLKEKPSRCSHVIAIGMIRDPKRSVPEVEEIAAVSCSVQNMSLVATEYGVGSYWGTGGITYYEEAKEFFGLKKDDRLMGFFFVGKLDAEWPKPGRRKSLEEYVSWVRN